MAFSSGKSASLGEAIDYKWLAPFGRHGSCDCCKRRDVPTVDEAFAPGTGPKASHRAAFATVGTEFHNALVGGPDRTSIDMMTADGVARANFDRTRERSRRAGLRFRNGLLSLIAAIIACRRSVASNR